ncbi:MAG: spore coat protein [Bacilli bacterium]|nr:spore coat protein [Bacilli bacterium]
MNDRLLLENYLLVLKSTVEVYVHGTLESSNKNVRETLKAGLDETMKHQANTYDLMAQNGWYVISNVKANEINKTLNKVNKNN